uniref:Uncharacterized protein n=1 Tax=Lepeophtheirus salmonis TaxID=72036 RepID=A0A0K2UAR6_LEPSM
MIIGSVQTLKKKKKVQHSKCTLPAKFEKSPYFLNTPCILDLRHSNDSKFVEYEINQFVVLFNKYNICIYSILNRSTSVLDHNSFRFCHLLSLLRDRSVEYSNAQLVT